MPQPPELRIQLTRRADGSTVLRCTRADGSVTWQRQDARHAAFFAFHDLRHFAVETVLGVRHAFYGLIADGWDIADTTGKGTRGPLPAEALVVEQLVGLLDRERAGGAAPMSAADVGAQLAAVAGPQRMDGWRAPTDAELAAVRARAESLHEAWAALGPDGTLELAFDRGQRG
jgi:hypothetical protein